MMKKGFVDNELVIITKGLMDVLLKEENNSDLISLYLFYYYTSKWQKTNIIKATRKYVMQGLHWGTSRFKKANDRLIELNLIKRIIRRDEKGKAEGWYIQIYYVWGREKIEEVEKGLISTKLIEDKNSKITDYGIKVNNFKKFIKPKYFLDFIKKLSNIFLKINNKYQKNHFPSDSYKDIKINTERYIKNYLIPVEIVITSDSLFKKISNMENINEKEIANYIEGNFSYENYSDFLKTLYWKIISYHVKKLNKFTCQICNKHYSRKEGLYKLEVHHKTYDRHGYEHKYYKEDLICLCHSCHDKIHNKK